MIGEVSAVSLTIADEHLNSVTFTSDQKQIAIVKEVIVSGSPERESRVELYECEDMIKVKECSLRISHESHVTSISELDSRFFVLSTSLGEIIYLDKELTILNSYKLSSTRADLVFQDKDGGLIYSTLDR